MNGDGRDRIAEALALMRSGEKWEARTLLLDELRSSTDRRSEVLTVLDKHFPLSKRQKKALDDLLTGSDRDAQAIALEVMLDAPDPRFTDALIARAREDEPRAVEALLQVREAYAGEQLEEAFPEPGEAIEHAIARIHAGASGNDIDQEAPPPPSDAPEDTLWGLVDEVRQADALIYGPSGPALKSSAKKKPGSKRVRRVR